VGFGVASGRVAIAEGGKEATYTGGGSICTFDEICHICRITSTDCLTIGR
jgi:hypothetical protein